MSTVTELPKDIEVQLKKILTDLNKLVDKLPVQAKAAAGILATLLGYGKPKTKESLAPEDVIDIAASIDVIQEAGAKLNSATRAALVAILNQLKDILTKAGYEYPHYGYPRYAQYGYSDFGYPKYEYHKYGYHRYPYAREGQNLAEAVKLLEAVEDADGLQWKVIALEEGVTRTGKRMYSDGALQDAVRLLEAGNVPCYLNHAPANSVDARRLEDKAGWYDSPEVTQLNGKRGVLATLNVLRTSPLRDMLVEAWDRGKPELVGFSINAQGRLKNSYHEGKAVQLVEGLDQLFSCDAVSEAAAGGRPVSLLAGITEEEVSMLEGVKTIEELAELIRGDNPELAAQLEEVKKKKEEEEEIKAAKKKEEEEEEKKKLKEAKAYCPACDKGVTGKAGDKCPTCGAILEPYAPPKVKEAATKAYCPKCDKGVTGKAGDKCPACGATLLPYQPPVKASELEEIRANLREVMKQNQVLVCGRKLTEALASTELPNPFKQKISKRFADKVFEDAELTGAIKDEENLFDQLMQDKAVSRVTIMADERDKLQVRMDAMFEGAPVDGISGFSGLKEAYAVICRKPIWESVSPLEIIRAAQGFDSGIREAVTPTTFADIIGTSMTRQMIKWYREPLYDDWRQIVSSIQDTVDVKAQERLRAPGYGAIPEVAWGDAYQEATTGADEKITLDLKKYGILESIIDKVIINDDLGAVRDIPRRLGLGAKYGLYKAVFDKIANNDTYDVDSTAIFDTTHANWDANELTYANLTTAKRKMRLQAIPVGAGVTAPFLNIAPKFLLVPPHLEATALELRNSEYAPKAQVWEGETNIHRGTFEVIVVATFTDAENWYMVADPRIVPTIEVDFYGGQNPQLFTERPDTGSQFTADKVTYKVRFIWGVDFLDFRGLYAGIPA